MTTGQVLKKIETLLLDAEQRRMYGSVELVIQGGHVTVLKKTETDRLGAGENTPHHVTAKLPR